MQNHLYKQRLGLPHLQVNAVSVSAERIDIYGESTFKACHGPVCLEPFSLGVLLVGAGLQQNKQRLYYLGHESSPGVGLKSFVAIEPTPSG